MRLTPLVKERDGQAPESPSVIPCGEHEAIEVPMDYVLGSHGRMILNPEIESGDYFAVSLSRGVLSLRTRGYVGYIPINDRVVVHVRPRVPVANLTEIVEVTGLRTTVLSALRDYSLTDSWSNSVADLYAVALVGQIELIVLQGLLRDYRRDEQSSSFPLGRVLIGPTIQSHLARGEQHRARSTWFTRTIDNPVNRTVKYAMWLLGEHFAYKSSLERDQRQVLRDLNSLYGTFDGVRLDHSRGFVRDSVVAGRRELPAFRAYYRRALDISLAVIEQRGLLLEDGRGPNVRLPSLVLDMSKLFEAYVRKVLQLHAVERGWPWQVVDGKDEGSRPLYTGQASPAATPDIVVRGPGIEPLVLEVKYIPVDGRSPRDALNQAVTYATCYGTKRVVLVHPCDHGQVPGLQKSGSVGDVEVFQYRFDLDVTELHLEASRFAQAIEECLSAQALPIELAAR